MASHTRDFHHPFKPYRIQEEFMEALYQCLEQGQVGIFESPTGNGEPDWVVAHAKETRRELILQAKADVEARLLKIREKERHEKHRDESGQAYSKRAKTGNESSKEEAALLEDQYGLNDYESDEETGSGPTSKYQKTVLDGVSSASLELMSKLGMVHERGRESEDFNLPGNVKIYYSSRTHSQLTQFADEVRRIKLPASDETEKYTKESKDPNQLAEVIKYLTLGSRRNLCINPKVSKLGSNAAINEACLDLQGASTPAERKCQFVPNKENVALVDRFGNHAMAVVRDIEDLGNLGKGLGICPYYASRNAIKSSEVVSLPYPLLLQKSAREALDISLKDHIVIIDEAHNLMDAISNIHSSAVSLTQLRRSRAQLGIYLQKFRNKLKGKNRVYVTQVIRLIDSLISCLEKISQKPGSTSGIAGYTELMAGNGVDQVNLYKLDKYLIESKLARKVDGYIDFTEKAKDPSKTTEKISSPVLTQVQGFLQTLTNPATEGRFFYSRLESGDWELKYMLLDPMHPFRHVVDEARAVVLAGGTMSPMDDYVQHLFPYLKPERLRTLSCDHVIPTRNLVAWPVTRGRTNVEFDFTFGKRSLPNMIDELGQSLLDLSKVIPDGLVVFFPSYAYLEEVTSRWKKESGRGTSIWTKLADRKPVFQESKTGSGTDEVLGEYTQSIQRDRGGILLSIVGGKMSEGINFSDRLGRGVAVVGLPFPNIQSPEWKAKMGYIKASSMSRGGSLSNGTTAARDFYENACMRAVNQSVGRAIRHQNDYASIIMLDKRYDSQRIRSKLPGWIQKSLVEDAGQKSFKDVLDSLDSFFKAKQ